MNVYRWPPALGLRQQRWSVEQPVASSRSLFSGARYVSAHGRRRRVVDFEVSIRANHGYGLMEGLIAVLEGGKHLVRLSWAAPTDVRVQRYATPFSWDAGFAWSSGYAWGGKIVGTPVSGRIPAVSLTGLTASRTVARAGEFISASGATRRLIADVTADASGVATAYLDEAFPDGTFIAPPVAGGAYSSGYSSGYDVAPASEPSSYVTLGTAQTAIFEAVEIPEVPWTWSSDGSVNWRFREIHADEISEPLIELAPWGT